MDEFEYGQLRLGIKGVPGIVAVVLGDSLISLDPSTAREIGEKFIEAADVATDGLIEEFTTS
jgi:hypothetical protein